MKGREKKAKKKREKEEEAVTNYLEEVTEDIQKMKEEDNTSMLFAKISVQPWKAEDKKFKEEWQGVVGERFNISRKIWLTLTQHRDGKGLKKFMSQPVFNQWLDGKRTNKLKDGWRDLVRSFIDANEKDNVGEGPTP